MGIRVGFFSLLFILLLLLLILLFLLLFLLRPRLGGLRAGAAQPLCFRPGAAFPPQGRRGGARARSGGIAAHPRGRTGERSCCPRLPLTPLCSLCPAVRRAAPLRRHGGGGHPHHHVRGPSRRPPHAARAPPEPRAAAALAPVPARCPRQRHAPRHGRLCQRRPQER